MFKNKKTLLPIFIGIAIIIIAIIAFVLIGLNEKNNKVSNTIILNGTNTAASNETASNTDKNDVDNEVDDENTIDWENAEISVDVSKKFNDIDAEYVNAIKQFLRGYVDSDEMQDFLDDYFDPKAYVAFENADKDIDEFMNEYAKIDDDDDDVETVEETLLSLEDSLNEVISFMALFSGMSTDMEDNSVNVADTDEDTDIELDVDFSSSSSFDSFTEDDLVLTLEDIEDAEELDDEGSFKRFKVTISFFGEEDSMYMYFYENIVIYMADEDGNGMLEE